MGQTRPCQQGTQQPPAAMRLARWLERGHGRCIASSGHAAMCRTTLRGAPPSRRGRQSPASQQHTTSTQQLDGPSTSGRSSDGATRPGTASTAASYKVLFAILAKLSAPGSRPGRLEAFLRAQPTASSIPFISWLSELEAAAPPGPEKQRLGSLCGLLVGAREALDAEGQGELYAACVAALGAGNAGQEGLLVSEPGVYAAKLAEAMTGAEVVREGFSPGIDALLAVAPAAALTPEGVRKGHELATELAADMRTRRRRSFAAVVGRTKLTAQQEEALLKSSPAARILDMLLALPSSEERLGLLPDCFEAPPAVSEANASEETSSSSSGGGGGGQGADDASSSSSRGAAGGAAVSSPQPSTAADEQEGPSSEEGDGATDELWCTPLQLLNEVDARLRAVQLRPADAAAAAAAQQAGDDAGPVLLPGGHGLVGKEYVLALQELDAAIRSRWLESLPMGPSSGSEGV